MSDPMMVEVVVDASKFLDVNLWDAMEEAVLDQYYKSFKRFGKGPADWVWNIVVDASQVEAVVVAGRNLVLAAIGVFIRRKLLRNLNTLEDLLDDHGASPITSSDSGVDIGVTIAPLTDKYLKTKEKRKSPGFMKKQGFAARDVFITMAKQTGNAGGVYTYTWESANSNWIKFNLGDQDNNQEDRPVIDILREYFRESFESLIGHLNTVPFDSYEEVARIIESRV